MLKITCVASAAVTTALAGPAAPAFGAGGDGSVRFFADIPCKRPATTQLNTETLVGGLRTLSFRRVEDVRASVPARSRGRTVGRLTVGIGVERRRYALRMPRTRRRSLELLDEDGTRVVLRPGARTFLSVYGLPEGTTSAFMTFSGAGRGVVDRPAGGNRPTIRLAAYRHEARSVQLTVEQRCV